MNPSKTQETGNFTYTGVAQKTAKKKPGVTDQTFGYAVRTSSCCVSTTDGASVPGLRVVALACPRTDTAGRPLVSAAAVTDVGAVSGPCRPVSPPAIPRNWNTEGGGVTFSLKKRCIDRMSQLTAGCDLHFYRSAEVLGYFLLVHFLYLENYWFTLDSYYYSIILISVVLALCNHTTLHPAFSFLASPFSGIRNRRKL